MRNCLIVAVAGFSLLGCSPNGSSNPTPNPSPVGTVIQSASSAAPTPDELKVGAQKMIGTWVPTPGYIGRDSGVFEFRKDNTFTCTRQDDVAGRPEFGHVTVVLSGNYSLDMGASMGMRGKITFGIKTVKITCADPMKQADLDQAAAQAQQKFTTSPDIISESGWSADDELDFNPITTDGLSDKLIAYKKKI